MRKQVRKTSQELENKSDGMLQKLYNSVVQDAGSAPQMLESFEAFLKVVIE